TGNITITNTGSFVAGIERGIAALSTNGNISIQSLIGDADQGGWVTATNSHGIVATTSRDAGLIDIDVRNVDALSGHGIIATATNGGSTIMVDVYHSVQGGLDSFEDGVRAQGSTTSD